jgi:hypothetical protein
MNFDFFVNKYEFSEIYSYFRIFYFKKFLTKILFRGDSEMICSKQKF